MAFRPLLNYALRQRHLEGGKWTKWNLCILPSPCSTIRWHVRSDVLLRNSEACWFVSEQPQVKHIIARTACSIPFVAREKKTRFTETLAASFYLDLQPS